MLFGPMLFNQMVSGQNLFSLSFFFKCCLLKAAQITLGLMLFGQMFFHSNAIWANAA